MLPRSIKNTKQIVEKIKIMCTVSNKKAKCINLSFFSENFKDWTDYESWVGGWGEGREGGLNLDFLDYHLD